MRIQHSAQIAIAGGGLLGRLLAWRLARGGCRITLYEARALDAPGGACWTAAGMISPLAELVHCPRAVYDLGMESLALWPQWARELEAETGGSVAFRSAGSVLVAHQQDRSELQQFLRELRGKLKGQSTQQIGEEQLEILDNKRLCELEPALERFDGGLYLKPEADIDNRRLLPLLLCALRKLDVSLHEQSPVECFAGEIEDHTGKLTFDCVVDCRGLGAKRQIDGLRGVRGEVLVVETNEVRLQRPVRLLHPRYQLYAVPRNANQTIIGATEIESEDMSPVSLRSTLELGSALYSLHPAFAEARIVETRVNCRPATMDNLPYLRSEPGLLRINGLYRHGYLLAPALVARVEKLLCEQLPVRIENSLAQVN